jgi:hypothetical protein
MSTLLEQASLVLIPSGYKEDVVYSQIPTNGNGDLSFTRASNGTRINSAGLVEVCPWNLLQQSETFTNGIWSKNATAINTAIGASGIEANVANAPNGTLTADRVNFNLQSDLDLGMQQLYSPAIASQSFVSSIYVKGEGSNIGKQIKLRTKRSTGGTFVSVDTTITLTADWVRITSSALTLLANNTGIQYIISSNDATNALIWGAQLNEGSTAKPYFPTTDRLNVPRLTYQNGGGGCPSLLLEPQRTNSFTYSEQFDNAAWVKIAATSVTANSAISPDGTQNADTLNSTTPTEAIFQVSASGTITFSVYAKAGTTTSLQLASTISFNGRGADFNLSNGTCSAVYQIGSGDADINGGTSSIVNVGNGWYRCIISGLVLTASRALTIANNNGNASYIYGAQCEAGAYPTTYIPTTTASATRVADAFSRNNIFTNGLITSSGGTWFVELLNNFSLTRDASDVGLFIGNSSNGTSGDVLAIRNNGTGRLSITKRISGTQTGLYETTTNTTKIAIKWNGSTADVFVNGTKQVSATSFTATNMEFLNGIGADVPKFISQMDLFPTPLTDAECIALTTI